MSAFGILNVAGRTVFSHGLVAGLGRILLLAAYLEGMTSIFRGNPAGPLMGLIFVAIIAYGAGPEAAATILLYPDRGLWESPGWKSRFEAWILSGIFLGCFFLISATFLYNRRFHGAWIFPLPSVAMGLQKLTDLLVRRGRPRAASRPMSLSGNEPPAEMVVPGLHKEQVG